MKNKILATVMFNTLILASCINDRLVTPPSSSGNVFINAPTANIMIESYLSSVANMEGQLHAVIMDVDSLRTYFADTSIRKVKIMLAHTLNYINEGNEGVYAEYKQNALTMVLGGVDRYGNYVLHNGATVPNSGVPCPKNCWTAGNAQSDLFPNVIYHPKFGPIIDK